MDMSVKKAKMPSAYKALDQSEIEYDGGMSKLGEGLLIAGCAIVGTALLCGAGYGIYKMCSKGGAGLTPAPDKAEGMWFTTNENSLNQVITMNGGIKAAYSVTGSRALAAGYGGLVIETNGGRNICFGTLFRTT